MHNAKEFFGDDEVKPGEDSLEVEQVLAQGLLNQNSLEKYTSAVEKIGNNNQSADDFLNDAIALARLISQM